GSVTKIGFGAFSGCESLANVSLGKGLKTIGYNAFGGCTSLASITLPSTVTTIDGGVFQNCSALKKISIPSGVKVIDSYTFRNCTSLSSVTIPVTVTKIEHDAFAYCSALTGITIPTSVTQLGDFAFAHCTGLKSIALPKGLTEIGPFAFYEDTALKTVTISDTVTSIGSYAFGNCTSLAGIVIPDSVTLMESDVFAGCTALKDVTLSKNITDVELFEGCTSLTSIRIPTGVTRIAGFKGCTSLTSIILPKTLTTLGIFTFEDCPALKDIYFKGTKSQWQDLGADIPSNPKIHYNFVDYDAPCNAPVLANTASGVNVKWEQVEDASGYYIFRKATDETAYTRIKVISSNYDSFTDQTAEPGVSYTYKIRPYYKDSDGVTHLGKYSKAVSIRYVSKAVISKLENKKKGITVTWDEIPGVSVYQVYRKLSGESSYTKISELTAESLAFTDEDVASGKTYSYKVRGYYKTSGGKKYYGVYSAVISLRRIGTPTLSIESSGITPKIAWNKQAGVTGYQVYRQEADGSFKRVKETTSLSYTDMNAAPQITYTYKVRGYYTNSKGVTTTGTFSNLVVVTIP
ncbi:MAG: leucine-rich repeat protein, partial [Erysipelotrichales bacterium]|nr:leucine-rich repeat protein [Erysipelotrichales bacterium]